MVKYKIDKDTTMGDILSIRDVVEQHRICEKLMSRTSDQYTKILMEFMVDLQQVEKSLKQVDQILTRIGRFSKESITNSSICFDELTFRTGRILKDQGFETNDDLISAGAARLLCIRQFGRKSLNDVEAYLNQRNLTLYKD